MRASIGPYVLSSGSGSNVLRNLTPLFLAAVALGACRTTTGLRPVSSAPQLPQTDVIIVCGKAVTIDAPVVLWTDVPGYDATLPRSRFLTDGEVDVRAGELRYTPGRVESSSQRVLVPPGSNDLTRLQSVVDLFVLHYDACGTSRRCFEVLHDVRGLSVHFLLDQDGTLYQTMDLRDQGWHARQANPRSIGVEIANIGAFPVEKREQLENWYRFDSAGTRFIVPPEWGDGDFRRPDYVPRPARSQAVRGRVQGSELVMYDLTPEQYDSLLALSAALCRIFPRIEPRAPRDANGRIRSDVLTEAEFEAYSGLIGHLHVSRDKVDPGPAFDWEGLLRRLRERLAQEPTSRLEPPASLGRPQSMARHDDRDLDSAIGLLK